MTLPKSVTSVTPFSKFLALIFFVMLPFLGFFFGMAYQQQVDSLPQESVPSEYSNPSPTPTPLKDLDTSGWKTFRSTEYKYELKIPSNWGVSIDSLPVATSQANKYENVYLNIDRNEEIITALDEGRTFIQILNPVGGVCEGPEGICREEQATINGIKVTKYIHNDIDLVSYLFKEESMLLLINGFGNQDTIRSVVSSVRFTK